MTFQAFLFFFSTIEPCQLNKLPPKRIYHLSHKEKERKQTVIGLSPLNKGEESEQLTLHHPFRKEPFITFTDIVSIQNISGHFWWKILLLNVFRVEKL